VNSGISVSFTTNASALMAPFDVFGQLHFVISHPSTVWRLVQIRFRKRPAAMAAYVGASLER